MNNILSGSDSGHNLNKLSPNIISITVVLLHSFVILIYFNTRIWKKKLVHNTDKSNEDHKSLNYSLKSQFFKKYLKLRLCSIHTVLIS